jgi:hypothetical protein
MQNTYWPNFFLWENPIHFAYPDGDIWFFKSTATLLV